MAKQDWARWIFASVATVFKQLATTLEIPILVEHLDERTDAFMNATDRVEIHITGPFIRELSNNYYQIFVDVNVLLTSRYDGNLKNAYDILKYAGAFQAAMDEPISIWNYGGEEGDYVEEDDEEGEDTRIFIGCLEPRPGQNIPLHNYGQTDLVEKLKQTEVNAKYVMYLTVT